MVESDCCCLGRMRPLNFARPGRYEACVVTQASLYAAVLFWLVSLWSIVSNLAGTMSIIEVAFEALLDFISTSPRARMGMLALHIFTEETFFESMSFPAILPNFVNFF